MEYEKCYEFVPDADTRPTKKRRVESRGLHKSWSHRQHIYEKAWRATKNRIDNNLKTINKGTVNELFRFLGGASNGADQIPIAFISTGAEGSSVDSIITQLSDYMNKTKHRRLISVSASDGSNLKALVKSIIRKATFRDEGVDEDDATAESSKGKVNARLLNYDLQILANHVKFDQIRQIIVTFRDTESFDSDLLSDLIELLGYYTDRIPIIFIFCLATSVDFLQQRLSRTAVKSLSGQLFDLAPLSAEIEQVFEAIIDDESPIWIGPSLMTMLFERQNDYIQSIDNLVNEIQYAYMSAYYANALTMFLNTDSEFQEIPTDHYLAVKNLPSFRAWFTKKLNSDYGAQRLKDTLENDELLKEVICGQMLANRDIIVEITTAIQLIRDLQKILPGVQETPKLNLYIQAMSNKLSGSSLIRTLLLSIRKSPSNITEQITDFIARAKLASPYNYKFACIRRELWELFDIQTDREQPLRSEDDVQNSTLRTTVVAQKVELSKQKSTLSKQDAAYTMLLRKFTDTLEMYLKAVFVNPKGLFFNEVFIYDLKSPHREVFMPRPRHAAERALAAPHDYLDCNCCAPGKDDGDEQTLSASQPATAILYQLYLESGNLINVRDLWQAFQAVVGDERTDEQNMALFQRALAEMKYLGMMKTTRKRVDHVQKCLWKGL